MNYVLHEQPWFTDLTCLISQHSFTHLILHARHLPLDVPRLRPVQCVLHTFTDPHPAHLCTPACLQSARSLNTCRRGKSSPTMRKCCATPPLLIVVSRVCRMRPHLESFLDFNACSPQHFETLLQSRRPSGWRSTACGRTPPAPPRRSPS